MRVIKATYYGFRTVIVVCHNPDDPSYIHEDGTSHPLENVNGCGSDEFGLVVCHSNHRIEEFIFDGQDQYRGETLLTADELWEAICDRCAVAPAAIEIVGLVGRSE